MSETHVQPSPIDEISLTENILSVTHRAANSWARSLAGAAGITALAVAPTSRSLPRRTNAAHMAAVPASDAAILQYALTLEHLETAFYAEALMHFTTGYLGGLVKVLHSDEAQHVAALTAALKANGAKPVAAASMYRFGSAFTSRHNFLNFAQLLEDTGVKAYLDRPATSRPRPFC